eukprot:6012996-Ditylum_brightwellii.AAC.1
MEKDEGCAVLPSSKKEEHVQYARQVKNSMLFQNAKRETGEEIYTKATTKLGVQKAKNNAVMPFLKNDGPMKYAQECVRDENVVCADKSTASNQKKIHPNHKNQREE